jgi:alpha-glucosidase
MATVKRHSARWVTACSASTIPPGVLAVLTGLLLCWHTAGSVEIASPDARLTVDLDVDDEGRPGYRLFRDGEPLIRRSPLGLSTDSADLSRALVVVSYSEPETVRGEYRLWTGKRRKARFEGIERSLTLRTRTAESLTIRMRLFNDGLAWRYELPGDAADSETIEAEFSGVHFFSETRAWLQPKAEARSGWSQVNPSYEEDYRQAIAVGEPAPGDAGWVFPALFKYRNSWLVLTEAGMDGGWPGSSLARHSEDGLYRLRFPQAPEVVFDGARAPSGPRPLRSPWRILAVGELATIVDSTLGTDLAAPTALKETDFIEPGAAAWSWGVLKDDSVTLAVQKEFIEYAARMQWAYVLVDVNWDARIGYAGIAELIDHGRDRGVGLFLWYNSSGDWNETKYTPKGQLLRREDRRREFAKLERMGVRGIKVDFFPGDGASVFKYYTDILEDAADHRLMVNFHGSTLPRGLQRTYPNLMTSEAVKGFEFVTFEQPNADSEATHVAMLPFTRNLFDPMDFTPTVLGDIPDIARRTSNGFQLALPVLLWSGLQHIVTTPAQMSAVPDFAQDYLRSLPVVWDESRLVAGEPGQFVVLARRAGTRWYVAGVNANEPRRLEMNLGFAGSASGTIIRDAAKSMRELEQGFVAPGPIVLDLEPGAGFVAVFPSGFNE